MIRVELVPVREDGLLVAVFEVLRQWKMPERFAGERPRLPERGGIAASVPGATPGDGGRVGRGDAQRAHQVSLAGAKQGDGIDGSGAVLRVNAQGCRVLAGLVLRCPGLARI